MRRLCALCLIVVAALAAMLLPDERFAPGGGPLTRLRAAFAQAIGYLQEFTGAPASPQSWQLAGWDVSVHSRNLETWHTLDAMHAGHGPDCGPPPATHAVSAYEDAVFQCRDHVMTALNAEGYGVVYLTPNQMVDFSAGEAAIRWDMSTLRTAHRDWIDLWVSPYDEHVQLPLEEWQPVDLQGPPRRGVHIRMDNFLNQDKLATVFNAEIIQGFASQRAPSTGNDFVGYESFLDPSATRRDVFELRVSRTHIKFGMPAYNFWWVDTDVADLGWSQGVVQFGHHSYTPNKECDRVPSLPCQPNTWHWDNVSVSPAIPFTILRGDRRFVDQTTVGQVTFPAGAPAGAHLRFAAIGTNVRLSFDGGQTWQAAHLQAQARNVDGHFRSYWTPIPAGVTSVQVRGEGSWWGPQWMARDFSIWSRNASTGSPVPSATVLLPTATGAAATPSASVTSTATLSPPTATRTATATATSTATVSSSTATRTSTASPTRTPPPAASATALAPPPSATTTAALRFTTIANIVGSWIVIGKPVPLTARVTSQSATTALVDLEVYDPLGRKVCQQFFEGQSFSAGQTKSYSVTCSLPAGTAAGLYVVKIGVFSPGWSTLYSWNDRAALFIVLSPPRPTATPRPR